MPFPMLIIGSVLLALMSVFARAETASPMPHLFSVGINTDAGVMARWSPKWEGASKNAWTASPLLGVNSITLPLVGSFGGKEGGLILSPSIRYVTGRSATDGPGLTDVADALELGGKVGWRLSYVRAFAAVRQGVTGHYGIRADIGADLIMMPVMAETFTATDRIELEIGPRARISSVDYTRTYFGRDTSGGLTAAGIESTMRVTVTPSWVVVGTLGYDRLLGDVTRSPVVQNGSEDQFSGGIGVTYRFGLPK